MVGGEPRLARRQHQLREMESPLQVAESEERPGQLLPRVAQIQVVVLSHRLEDLDDLLSK